VNQKVAVRQLTKLGYRADVVANGREALEALGRIAYDLVLMDCQMPEMDGYAATAEIRRREGETKHTPIVAMTAHALESDRLKCLAAGMDDYISKPVRPDELATVLDRLLAETSNDVQAGSTPTPEIISLPVNMGQLYQVLGDEPEEIFTILRIYEEQMAKDFENLAAAIESGNAKVLYVIAHTCLGASLNCGIIAVLEPLRELERMGRENQLTGAAEVNAQLGREFARVKLFLQASQEPAVV
jgi:CheY-like chemotaxis protein/HPt (histidine-containing phosphotransfer) domain-containing protein